MIEVPVKIQWQGKVGINEERYVKPAIQSRQGLRITLLETGEIMLLSAEQVVRLKVARSERRFKDKFGGKPYYLVYYAWKPNVKQAVLL